MQSQISSEVHRMSSPCVLMLKLYIIIFYSNSTQLNIICTIWWRMSTDYNHVSFCKCVFEADQHESGWWTDTDEWRARFNKTDRLTLTDLWRLQVVTHRPGTQIKGGESVRRESCLGQLRREGGGGKEREEDWAEATGSHLFYRCLSIVLMKGVMSKILETERKKRTSKRKNGWRRRRERDCASEGCRDQERDGG